MPWNDFLQDTRFTTLGPEDQRKVADQYFKDTFEVDQRYSSLGSQEKTKVKRAFLATIGQEPDTVGGVLAPWQTGLARIAALPSGALEVAAAFTDDPAKQQQRVQLAETFRERAEGLVPEAQPTGGFAEPLDWKDWNPSSPRSPINPKRMYLEIATQSPITGAFMLPMALGGPTGVALSSAMMFMAEGGDAAQALREFEESTGTKLSDDQKRATIAAVGLVNTAVETFSTRTLLGKGAVDSVKAPLMRALISGFTEGAEEFIQQGNQILAQASYGDAGTREEILNELAQAAYGGALVGTVIGGGREVLQRKAPEAPAPNEVVLDNTKLPRALTVDETPEMLAARGRVREAQARMFTALEEGVTITAEGTIDLAPESPAVQAARTEYSKAVDQLHQRFMVENPEDTGERWAAYHDELVRAIEPIALTPVTEAELKAKTLLRPIVGVREMEINLTGKVAKEDVDRLLVALSYAGRISPDATRAMQKVELVSGKADTWRKAVVRSLTFGQTGSAHSVDWFIKQDPIAAQEFLTAAEKSVAFTNGVGDVVIRASKTPQAPTRAQSYLNGVVHEMVHRLEVQDRNAFLNDAQAEAAATAAGHRAQALFEVDQPSWLSYQQRPKSRVLQLWRVGEPEGKSGTFYSTRQFSKRQVPYEVGFNNLLYVPKSEVAAFVGAPAEYLAVRWFPDVDFSDLADKLYDDPDADVLVMDKLVASEAARRGYDGIYYETGEKTVHGMGDVIQAATKVDWELQDKVDYQHSPTLGFEPRPTELQRHRLVSGVTALGFTVYRAQGQLYDSASGTPVNAAIDHNTKSIYLSKEIQFDTVGHELAEYMIRRLGPTDEVVRRGLELFGGNKEALSDAVGAYYAGRQLEQGVLAQLHRWLKELYAAFKNAVGAELSVEQVAAIINLEAMKLTEPTTASAAEFSFQYRKLYRGLGSGGRTVGGASFGAGVYMSSKEAVGKDYAMMAALKALPLEYTRAVDFLKQYGKERALAELHARALTITGNERTAAAKAIKLINDGKVTISTSGEIGFSELKPRRLLTADVDVDALNWLRWYEPIPEAQLSAVAQQMQQEGLSTADLSPDVWKAQITGADLYDGLALQLALKKPEDIYQQEDIDYGKREASALLARAGINGIRYPTHSLMGGAVPESERGENFVIFTPGVLRNTEVFDFQRRKPWQIPPGERRTTRPKAKESSLFRDVKEAMAWEDIARQVETPPAPVTPTQQARRLSDTARHAETYALWKRFIEPEVRAAFERTTSRDTGLSEEVLDNTALELISDPDKMTKLMAKALDPNQRQNLSHAEHRALNLYGAQRIESLRFSPEFLSRMDEDPVAASKWLLDQSKQLYELMEIDSRVQGQAFNMRKGWNTLEPLKLLAELDRELTPAERKELSAFFKKRFFTPEEIRSISNRITKPRARDLFTFFYGSNLITPGTQTVNAGSNFLNTMWLIGPGQLGEVAADAVLANPLVQAAFPGLKGYKRSKFVRGVWSGLRQTVSAEAVRPAYAQFKKAYANERPPFGDINKWEFYRGNPFRYAGLPRPLRVLAPFIGFNYRLLMAADIWFKVWARESRIASLRTNEAIRLGVPVEQIQITEEMRDDAKRFGADATFTMEPGKIIRSAHGIRNSIPFVGPLLTPFITTIGNITKSAVQRFPGLGVAVMKKDIEAQRYAKVMGRQIEGAVLTMMLLGLFWDRDDLIGAAPEEANKRDSFYRQGKQPYSFRVGNTWISYQRLEPFNIMLGTLLTFRDQVKEGLVNEDDASTMFANVAWAVAQNLIGTSFVDNLLNVYEGPGRFKAWVERTPANFVPMAGFWRFLNDNLTAGTLGYRPQRDNSVIASFAHVVPLGDLLLEASGKAAPLRINAMGEKSIVPGAALQLWLPVKWRQAQSDPVEQELAAKSIYPDLPSRTITLRPGQEYEMTDAEYWEYVHLYGSTVKEFMARAIRAPGYTGRDFDTQLLVLQRAQRQAQDRARAQAAASLRRRVGREVAMGTRTGI